MIKELVDIDLSKCVKMKSLNCSFNKIIILQTFPYNLEELHIHSNPIDQIITLLPSRLEVIGIDKNLISPEIFLNIDLLFLS
jgi:Leucine-rich repeat (LRR) protein